MPTTLSTLSGTDAVQYGLGKAWEEIQNQRAIQYPNYVSSAIKSPAQMEFARYSPNQPMATIQAPNYQISAKSQDWGQWTPLAGIQYETVNPNAQAAGYTFQNINTSTPWRAFTAQTYQGTTPQFQTVSTATPWADFQFQALKQEAPTYQKLSDIAPTYQGLLSGDYDALQRALALPGQQKIEDAYTKGLIDLKNTMGGQGLYGSSLMGNQLTNNLIKERMRAEAANEAAAAAQRYGMQQSDLAKAAEVGLNVYGQRMAEQANLNQMAQQNYQNALNQHLQGQQLMAQQNIARNQQAQAGTELGLKQALAGNEYNQNIFNQRLAENQALQNIGSQQALAQNAQNLTGTQMALQQALAGNQAGLDYAKLLTQVGQQNVANAMQQAQALNTLRSADVQQLQGLLAAQNLAKNQYLRDIYGIDTSREQSANQHALDAAKLMATQAANVYSAGVQDAQRQQSYDLSKLAFNQQQAEAQRQWENQQAYEQYLYQLARNQYENQQQEARINQALALAGQGAPLANAGQNYQLAQQQLAAQQQMAADRNATASQAGWLGLAGTLGGGLLANSNFTDWVTSIWD